MYEHVDTSSTVEIELDRVVMVGIIIVCLAFTATAWWAVFDPASHGRDIVAGWVGMLFFGGLTLLGTVRLFTWRGPVLTVSPQGVRYRHFATDLVPWSGVTAVGEWKYPLARSVMLSLAPGVEEKLLHRSIIRRWLRGPNRAFGVNGMLVSAMGLKASYYDIRNLITAFASAHANIDPPSGLVRPS
jgi:hypothetical protein